MRVVDEKEQEQVIDPSVIKGYGLENCTGIVSAEWGIYEEVTHRADGSEKTYRKRVPVINGMQICLERPENFRPLLEMFPMVPVRLDMNDWERNQAIKNPKFVPAEPIQWFTVRYMIPKGKNVLVPSPIADIVENSNTLLRTKDAIENHEILVPLEG